MRNIDYTSGVLLPLYLRGRVAAWSIVDADDYGWLSETTWGYDRVYGGAHAYLGEYGGTVGMHRLIMGVPKGDPRVVHHINEARLDNRRANLQIVRSLSEHGRMPHFHRDATACAQAWLTQRNDPIAHLRRVERDRVATTGGYRDDGGTDAGR